MDLRVLRYFLAVANEKNFSRAADLLHLTQPTLSRQIQDLEEELGEPVFVRYARHVELTAAGRFLKQRAEEILALAKKTEDEFRELNKGLSGNVHIGGGETIAMTHIGAVLRDVCATYPDIHFHLHSGNADDMTERLERGLIDFAVVIEPFNLAHYESLRLPHRDVWGVVMPENAPLAQKTVIHKEDLLGLPLICSRQAIYQHQVGNTFHDWFGETFDALNIVGTFNLIFNANLMVSNGLGYAIGLDGLVNTTDTGLTFRPFEPRLEAGTHVIWKKARIFSAASAVVLEALKTRFGA